ncbi:hypothetical protein [Hydrogenivirga sp.]
MSREVVLKKVDIEQDRFKVGVSMVVIITSGLVGLIFKREHALSDYVLSVGGVIIDLIFILYAIKTYLRVNLLLSELEEIDV